mgnify:FL=1
MEAFRIKNGISATRYLGSNGTETAGSEYYKILSNSGNEFSVVAQENNARSVCFNDTGTIMYVTGYSNRKIWQYTLSTAWDITTASYANKSLDVATQFGTSRPSIGYIADNGTKFYVALIAAGATVYQYNLSTAYDVSTASYSNNSITAPSSYTQYGFGISGDGTQVYFSDFTNKRVVTYDLTTAFDISTMDTNTESVSPAFSTALYGIYVDPTGAFLFTRTGYFEMSTSGDITTLTRRFNWYDTSSFSIIGGGYGFWPKSDNTKIFAVNNSTEVVYEIDTVSYTQALDLSTGTTFSFTPSGSTTVSFTNPPATGIAIGFSVEIVGDASVITWPSSIKWHLATAPTATATKELYTFVTTDGGTTYYGKKAAEGIA